LPEKGNSRWITRHLGARDFSRASCSPTDMQLVHTGHDVSMITISNCPVLPPEPHVSLFTAAPRKVSGPKKRHAGFPVWAVGPLTPQYPPWERTSRVGSSVPQVDSCTAAKIGSLDHRRHARAAWVAVRHHKHNLPQHLGELTIRVAINRNAEALHDASNLAK
jgi:hypothetical protein